ncbi:hypothetical protein ACRALDRAFT_207497 [Sodiomyces alcalophilus JCM 7366]|uniref:uncharacterized protein n=1 Tax=Sodiomyces alcalophilus JCM 7366 TaxID=591952 RepID=UPI0039B48245
MTPGTEREGGELAEVPLVPMRTSEASTNEVNNESDAPLKPSSSSVIQLSNFTTARTIDFTCTPYHHNTLSLMPLGSRATIAEA